MSSEVEIAKGYLGEDGDRQVAAEHSQGTGRWKPPVARTTTRIGFVSSPHGVTKSKGYSRSAFLVPESTDTTGSIQLGMLMAVVTAATGRGKPHEEHTAQTSSLVLGGACGVSGWRGGRSSRVPRLYVRPK
jgi:hypothetical protein